MPIVLSDLCEHTRVWLAVLLYICMTIVQHGVGINAGDCAVAADWVSTVTSGMPCQPVSQGNGAYSKGDVLVLQYQQQIVVWLIYRGIFVICV